jgi:hypothetical protein
MLGKVTVVIGHQPPHTSDGPGENSGAVVFCVVYRLLWSRGIFPNGSLARYAL